MDEAWVYLLRCRDGSLYTGWTVDLERRLARDRSGVASHYTASRLPSNSRWRSRCPTARLLVEWRHASNACRAGPNSRC